MVKKIKKKSVIFNDERLAIYGCLGCGYVYLDKAGIQDECERCGSLYMYWINYEDFKIDEE